MVGAQMKNQKKVRAGRKGGRKRARQRKAMGRRGKG